MGTNLSVLFYTKKKVKTIKGTTPIYLRITIDGQLFETGIHRQINSDNWLAKVGKAKRITEDVKILNAYLGRGQLKEFFIDIVRRLIPGPKIVWWMFCCSLKIALKIKCHFQ